MAISGYTTNYDWPLAGNATQNWGAIINGVLEDLDTALKEANNPLCDDDSALIYEGETLGYA